MFDATIDAGKDEGEDLFGSRKKGSFHISFDANAKIPFVFPPVSSPTFISFGVNLIKNIDIL
jgi:hypothetical protein